MTNPDETPKLTEETKDIDGQSFYNNSLTGSGTIVDGEYHDPLPDPTTLRGLGPNRTSGGRRVDIGEANVANLGMPEGDADADSDSQKGQQRAPAAKTTGPAAKK